MKVLFLGYVAYTQIWGGWSAYRETYSPANRSPLYGLYEVEKFQHNGTDVQPLLTEGKRWRYLAFEYPGTMWIRQMDNSVRYYPTTFETGKNILELGRGKDPFTYSHPDTEHLSMEGLLNGERFVLTLRKIDRSKFLLINRGFHWISEQPFNR